MTLIWTMVFAVLLYGLGWFAAVLWLTRMKGPVPTPNSTRRVMRDSLLWPFWVLLFGLFWLIDRRRQTFDAELVD